MNKEFVGRSDRRVEGGEYVTCTAYRPPLSSKSLSCASLPSVDRKSRRVHDVSFCRDHILVVCHRISVG